MQLSRKRNRALKPQNVQQSRKRIWFTTPKKLRASKFRASEHLNFAVTVAPGHIFQRRAVIFFQDPQNDPWRNNGKVRAAGQTLIKATAHGVALWRNRKIDKFFILGRSRFEATLVGMLLVYAYTVLFYGVVCVCDGGGQRVGRPSPLSRRTRKSDFPSTLFRGKLFGQFVSPYRGGRDAVRLEEKNCVSWRRFR